MPDFSLERFANNSRLARRLSGPRKPQTNRTTGPPGVNDYGLRFPDKSNPLQTFFFFFYLDCSVERWGGQHNDKQSGQRQRKNPLQKFKKLQSWGARQIINIQLSKLRFEAIFNVFVSRLVLVYRKGNFALNIMYGKFWLDGDLFVRNLGTSVKLR